MTAEHEAYDGSDALMAAITGDALRESARADAEFTARYRSAEADLTLLREQLRIIGDTLSRPTGRTEPELAPAPTPRPRRTWLPLAFGALAVAVVGFLVVGMGWLMAQGSGSNQESADTSGAAKSDARGAYSVCARLVVEGDVTRVEPVPGTGQERVTLRVTRFYKPASGKSRVTVLTDRSVAPPPRRGEHVLVGLPSHGSVPDLWVTGEQDIAGERAVVEQELNQTPTTSCP
ncbi:hypothetical protein [Streptomyces sp. NPDC002758]